MRVRYTRRALRDLRSIADYVRDLNPVAAREILKAIEATVGLLADFPRLGRDRPELNARTLGIPRYPYTTYYRIDQDAIWIVHIRDDRRAPLVSL